jgi:hypothetical protein
MPRWRSVTCHLWQSHKNRASRDSSKMRALLAVHPVQALRVAYKRSSHRIVRFHGSRRAKHRHGVWPGLSHIDKSPPVAQRCRMPDHPVQPPKNSPASSGRGLGREPSSSSRLRRSVWRRARSLSAASPRARSRPHHSRPKRPKSCGRSKRTAGP